MIKNIVFDLGGVILKEKPISVLDNRVDIVTYNELKRFFDGITELDTGNISLEELFNKCNFKKELIMKYKDVLIYYYKYRELNNEILELISKLKTNNYNIYVLSDNNRESIAYYKVNPLFKDIDGWVSSCEYNTTKTSGKLFEEFLNKYGLNAKECYFVDNEKTNINVANKYGIKGFLFNKNIKELIINMKNNNINL